MKCGFHCISIQCAGTIQYFVLKASCITHFECINSVPYKIYFKPSLSYTCKLHIFIKINHISYICVWLLQIIEINIKSKMVISLCSTATVLGRQRHTDMCKVHAPFFDRNFGPKENRDKVLNTCGCGAHFTITRLRCDTW